MKNKLKVVSLFSGIGGFEKGLEMSKINYEVVFASEIDKFAIQTYGCNFSLKNMHGDIKQINEIDIPDHDLLVGGFPCQSFSVAGKQKGFEDIRGTLFFDIIRIIKLKQPKMILLENVKNLVRHNNGNTIKTIIENISNCGYTFDLTVINSSEAGLPQSRERTYIVGILNYPVNKFEKDTRDSKLNEIKMWANKQKLNTMNFFNDIQMSKKRQYIKDIIDENVDEKYYINSPKVNDFINNLDKNKFNNKPQFKILKEFDLPKDVHNDLERQRRVYSIEGISPTLLARSDSPKIIINENNSYRIRKLTPYENFKIQGFDNVFLENIKKNNISDTQLYKQSGNAVSPPIIAEIINKMKEKFLDE